MSCPVPIAKALLSLGLDVVIYLKKKYIILCNKRKWY